MNVKSKCKDENEERWVDLEGDLSKYCVSSHGRVRNKKTGRILKQTITMGRYITVILSYNGHVTTLSVAKLMLIGFKIPNPNNYKMVGYRDGQPDNLSLDNLYWSDKKTIKNSIYDDTKEIIFLIQQYCKLARQVSGDDPKQYGVIMNNMKTLIKRDLDYIVLGKEYS